MKHNTHSSMLQAIDLELGDLLLGEDNNLYLFVELAEGKKLPEEVKSENVEFSLRAANYSWRHNYMVLRNMTTGESHYWVWNPKHDLKYQNFYLRNRNKFVFFWNSNFTKRC